LNLFKEPVPHSYYVFFNEISRGVIAKNFNITKDDVRIVHHPSDLDDVYGINDQNLKNFIEKRNVYSADAIAIYPIRLDRGKQVEHVIKTMAKVKEFDMEVRCIIVDFHSTGGDKVTYRDELKQLGIDWGLTPEELAFTSEFCQDWNLEVPHDVVMSLMRMSNIFIMPSVSESYSLITQEAALTKNLIVLNQDFPPYRDIFGKDAIFRKYSSNWDVMAGYDEAYAEGTSTNTLYGPEGISDQERKRTHEPNYHKETAAMIVDKLNNDMNLAMNRRIRKLRNFNYVFKHELEPLLWL
jgi:glycosyltransferase involved in cell wall biosynthesis